MFRAIVIALIVFAGLASSVVAQQPTPPSGTTVLFSNVRVFDGKSTSLIGPVNVLVQGNTIAKISKESIPTDRSGNTTLIDGGGRTLMPGLIDAHVHITLSDTPLLLFMTADSNYSMLRQAKAAGDTLMRGFTTVRDMGGNTFGLKRAIDEGFTTGPRIWPSGAIISQTSGHGDFRTIHDIPRNTGSKLHFSEGLGFAAITDGAPEVLRRVREQLMRGASQIKLMAGGGVSSDFDPLDVTQFTSQELEAAVEAAADWGTYVAVHAYTPRAVQKSIAAGVKVIEHGQMIDDSTAKLMSEKGIWWSLQPFLDDEDATPFPAHSPNRAKQLIMFKGTQTAYALAKKYNVKIAFGTDTLFDAKVASRQGQQLTKLLRWYAPAEVLIMATSGNGELLALSGPRSPYSGKLGVVEEGALADLLLVDGDPIADIKLIENPAKNFLVIMKDGKIFKRNS